MQFNSTTFIFFLVGVYFVYWAIAHLERTRLWFLTLASCAFYMSWNSKVILLVLLTAVVDYYVALAMARSQKPLHRRLLLLVTLTTNLGVLGFFKYTNFFAETLHAIGNAAGVADGKFTPWQILLPAGISFYTFQTLSYTIDVYRGTLQPSRDFTKFFLFITFFPQLVAGPIVRASAFLPQLDVAPVHDDRQALRGLLLVLKGLIKKVVLADTIGELVVDPLFNNSEQYGSLGVVLAGISGWFQLYLDFSAYSDIAIGTAAMLGFVLPINFNRPFLAQSVGEFWRRWHISLSTWFKDYVYLPMGGRGGGVVRAFCTLMGTMFLSGLWHGAGWNFVIWGLLLGFFMGVGRTFYPARTFAEREARPLWSRLMHRSVTVLLLGFTMIFFRNGTMDLGKQGIEGSLHMLRVLSSFTPAQAQLSTIGLFTFGVAVFLHYTPANWYERLEQRWQALPSFVQACVLVLFTGILGALSYQQRPFIYFQF